MKSCPFCDNENAVMCGKFGADLKNANNTNRKTQKKPLALLKIGLLLITVPYIIGFIIGFVIPFVDTGNEIVLSVYTVINSFLGVVQAVGLDISFISYAIFKNI